MQANSVNWHGEVGSFCVAIAGSNLADGDGEGTIKTAGTTSRRFHQIHRKCFRQLCS